MPPTKRKNVTKTRSRRSVIPESSSRSVGNHGKHDTKTVITKTFVRRSLGSVLDETPGRNDHLLNKQETWELRPKTDYTYARSPTYSARYIGQDWVMPNMSRPRLRGGAPVDISPITSQNTQSEVVSVRRSDNRQSSDQRRSVRSSRQTTPWSALLPDRSSHSRRSARTDASSNSRSSDTNRMTQESYTTQEVSTPTHRKGGHTLQSIEHDSEMDLRRFSDSVTRSGRRAAGRTTRPSQIVWDSPQEADLAHRDITDLTMEEYMRVEKQLEYSGRAGPHKESSRLSLYGLDQQELEDDMSDTEAYSRTPGSDQCPPSSSRPGVTPHSITTTILTVITSIVYTSWSLVRAPIIWITSLIQSDDNVSSTTTSSYTTTASNRNQSASKPNTSTTRATMVTRSSRISSFSDDDEIPGEQFVTEGKSVEVVSLDHEDTDDESYCSKCGFYAIFCVYLVCVELPIGVVHLLRRCLTGVHSSVLLTVGSARLLGQSVASFYSSVIQTDEHQKWGTIGTSSSRTSASVQQDTIQCHDNQTSSIVPDDESTVDQLSHKASLRRAKTVILTGDDDDDDDTSLCGQCCYYVIALVYLLCVVLPIGIAKSMRGSFTWICGLLYPVVDAVNWTVQIGRSLLPTRLWTTSTTNTTAATRTTSTTTTRSMSTGSVLWWTTAASTASTTAASTASSTAASTASTAAALGSVSRSIVYNGIQGIGYYSNSLTSSMWIVLRHFVDLLMLPWVAVTSGGAVCCRWCWKLGAWLHRVVANVLLIDVWLLSRVGERRSGACCCLLPLLLLLLLVPFLLLPGSRYFIASSVEGDKSASLLYGSQSATVKVSQPDTQTDTQSLSTHALREIIEEELILAKADLKSHDSALYKDNLAHIEVLESQLVALRSDVTKLETAQLALLAQLKDCCRNESTLTALVQSGVQQQLATIMMGGGSDGATEGDGGQSSGAVSGGGRTVNEESDSSKPYSNSAFVAWLNSQFTIPGDFDAKIVALTAELNRGLKEQAEKSRLAALAAAQAEQVARDAQKDAESAAGLAISVQTAQGEQAASWGRDKADISEAIAGAVTKLGDRDEQLASDIAAAAAILSVTNAGGTDAGSVGAGGQSDDGSGDAGVGLGIATGCGCNGNAFVLPDTYHTITEEQVKLLIREALGIFGADKTGMVDYALESAGGSVISTRCSETYHRRTAQLSLFGIPLWYTSNSPRTVIQPEVHPGQCWAFRGTQGYIVVQLAGYVHPTAFSLEHIPKVLSPSGQIDSAPKDFSVWGLKHERDVDGKLLGNYTYLDNEEPLQFFPVTDSTVDAYHIVELRILSNHGNQEYTCLYRFRVHGLLKRT